MWRYSFIMFAGVLAYIVGSNLSPAALTVLAGVGVGLLVSVPVAIVIVALATPRIKNLPAPTYFIIVHDPNYQPGGIRRGAENVGIIDIIPKRTEQDRY